MGFSSGCAMNGTCGFQEQNLFFRKEAVSSLKEVDCEGFKGNVIHSRVKGVSLLYYI